MKAREFIPEYDIDPDELHKAAYLQRKVDQYNAKYKNRKPIVNPNSPNADELPTKKFDPVGTFGDAFLRQLTDPAYQEPTMVTKGYRWAKGVKDAATNYTNQQSGSFK